MLSLTHTSLPFSPELSPCPPLLLPNQVRSELEEARVTAAAEGARWERESATLRAQLEQAQGELKDTVISGGLRTQSASFYHSERGV